jgi:hypothetical protein
MFFAIYYFFSNPLFEVTFGSFAGAQDEKFTGIILGFIGVDMIDYFYEHLNRPWNRSVEG